MTWRDTNLPQIGVCPWCDYRMDIASDPYGDARPKRGDFSICIRCGGLAVFTRSLRFRRPLPGELASLTPEELVKVSRLQAMARAILGNEP